MNTHNIFDQFFQKDDTYVPSYMDKQYLHFDMERGKDYIESILKELQDTDKLNHAFYPLIRYNIPKYKKCEDSKTGKYYIDKSDVRPIMHTARTDAMIYTYYRAVLMNK